MKTVVAPRAEASKVRSGNDHCPKCDFVLDRQTSQPDCSLTPLRRCRLDGNDKNDANDASHWTHTIGGATVSCWRHKPHSPMTRGSTTPRPINSNLSNDRTTNAKLPDVYQSGVA
ncbi:hypothetical protein TNCV_4106191 [Trichonephila clavipes]|nr:hypothetical protein TNCV_4106191 [Trichonephila clavipes]